MRKRVTVRIERSSDGSYWCDAKIGKGTYTASGDTVEKAKEDFMECLAEGAEAHEAGLENLEEMKFEYKFDLQSFFNFFSFLNMNEIARRAGINPSLLRQYKIGKKNASEKVYEKLTRCINEIKEEMSVATF